MSGLVQMFQCCCWIMFGLSAAFTVALTASPAEARPVRCPAEDKVASALW